LKCWVMHFPEVWRTGSAFRLHGSCSSDFLLNDKSPVCLFVCCDNSFCKNLKTCGFVFLHVWLDMCFCNFFCRNGGMSELMARSMVQSDKFELIDSTLPIPQSSVFCCQLGQEAWALTWLQLTP
jgi:hypothetical protein